MEPSTAIDYPRNHQELVMEAPWTVHGLFMDYHGLFMDHHGLSLKFPWTVS